MNYIRILLDNGIFPWLNPDKKTLEIASLFMHEDFCNISEEK